MFKTSRAIRSRSARGPSGRALALASRGWAPRSVRKTLSPTAIIYILGGASWIAMCFYAGWVLAIS